MEIDLKQWFEDGIEKQYTANDLEIIRQLAAIGLGDADLEIWKLWQWKAIKAMIVFIVGRYTVTPATIS